MVLHSSGHHHHRHSSGDHRHDHHGHHKHETHHGHHHHHRDSKTPEEDRNAKLNARRERDSSVAGITGHISPGAISSHDRPSARKSGSSNRHIAGAHAANASEDLATKKKGHHGSRAHHHHQSDAQVAASLSRQSREARKNERHSSRAKERTPHAQHTVSSENANDAVGDLANLEAMAVNEQDGDRVKELEQRLENNASEAERKRKKQRRVFIIIVLVLLAILVAGGGTAAAFFLGGWSDDKIPTVTNQTDILPTISESPSAPPTEGAVIPSDPPTFLVYGIPSADRCDLIRQGLPVEGQENMQQMSFELMMEIGLTATLDNEEDLYSNITNATQHVKAPELAGCSDVESDLGWNEFQYIIGNAIAQSFDAGGDAVARSFEAGDIDCNDESGAAVVCKTALLDLVLYLQGDELSLFDYIQRISKVFGGNTLAQELGLGDPVVYLRLVGVRTLDPTNSPTIRRSMEPSPEPSGAPSFAPVSFPTTEQPTAQPSSAPVTPSESPTTLPPTRLPTPMPSLRPSVQPAPDVTPPPTKLPTRAPTKSPSVTPTNMPSTEPSRVPTDEPSTNPSPQPSANPSQQPSPQPSRTPSIAPSHPCFQTNSDLYNAVMDWFDNDAVVVETQYGPMGDWCFGPDVTSMFALFLDRTNFDEDISGWDVSGITDMNGMFDCAGASSFNQDLSTWNVSSVTDMSHMFRSASSFNQDLSTWDVSSVTDMTQMFAGATSFNQDLSTWNVSSVTDMGGMFEGASSFNQDLSTWDVSSVTDMRQMFAFESSFNQNLCAWGSRLPPTVDTYDAFWDATSCPTQADPILSANPPGPFCHVC